MRSNFSFNYLDGVSNLSRMIPVRLEDSVTQMGGVASSRFFLRTGTHIVYFVGDSASELERWALLPF